LTFGATEYSESSTIGERTHQVNILSGLKLILTGVLAANTACLGPDISSSGEAPHQPVAVAPNAQDAVPERTDDADTDGPIRRIDFANLTYRWPQGLHARGEPWEFRLTDGTLKPTQDADGRVDDMGVDLAAVEYGDLTGDGRAEAVVVLALTTGGSSIPNIVYIYAVERGRPRILWSATTGDRAEGGLRRAAIEAGELVIELYGKYQLVGGDRLDFESDPDDSMVAACCPKFVTRSHYQFKRGRFRPVGRDVFPNPESNGSLAMPPPNSPSDQ
jgi:hypothetical protein